MPVQINDPKTSDPVTVCFASFVLFSPWIFHHKPLRAFPFILFFFVVVVSETFISTHSVSCDKS